MKDALSLLEKGYEHYFLHDVFAKIVPGSICLYPLLLLADPPIKVEGFIASLVFVGIAWIVSFILGTVGSKLGIIRDLPSEIGSDAWHKLMVDFIKLGDPVLMERRNRYMVIKEATGNCAMATLVLALVLILLVKMDSDILAPLHGHWAITLALAVGFAVLCIYTNWVHADRQYSFMRQALAQTGD